MNKNSTFYTSIFSFIVTFCFVIVLSFVNSGTKELVESNKRAKIYKVVLQTIGVKL